MSLLVLFLIVSSGSYFGCVWFERKYADILPFTFFSIVIFQYLSGMLGWLRYSTDAIIVISALVYLVSTWRIIKEKAISSFVHSFFSLGFWAFLLLFLVSYYFNIGKYCMEWDEFSHWADVVKAMLSIDDFAANPASRSAFRSYLPAMSLFQYLDQSLVRLIDGTGAFDEARLHFSYQLFTYSLIIPFFSMMNIKRIWLFLFGSLSAVFLPSMFYKFYSGVLIDSFLGVMCGFAFVYVVYMRNESGRLYRPMSLLTLAVLALTKDAGQGIALLLALVYGIEELIQAKSTLKGRKFTIRTMINAAWGLIIVFAVRYSWKWILFKYSAPVSFDGKIDAVFLLRVIFGLEPNNYRTEVLRTFWHKLIFDGAGAERFGIIVPFSLMLLALFTAIFIVIFAKRQIAEKEGQQEPITLRSGVYLVIVAFSYIIGTCISYMFKFTEYEALMVAGFNRYLFVIFTMLSFITLFLIVKYLSNYRNRFVQMMALAFIGVALLFSASGVIKFLTGGYVRESQIIRNGYASVEAASKYLNGQPDRVYFVSQEDEGYDYWTAKFLMRPQQVDDSPVGGWRGWSLGKPMYEGDIWSVDVSPNEWAEKLRNQSDYVLLYRINDSFVGQYAGLFRSTDEIREGVLYSVEKEKDVQLIPVNLQTN